MTEVASEGVAWSGSQFVPRFHQRENLSGHDGMHSGLGEAKLTGNDACAVTLLMKLSNLRAVDNHARPGEGQKLISRNGNLFHRRAP